MHIKITLHIQVLIYCQKNAPTHLIMGLPRMYAPHYTQQNNR